jgi:hypothetical protein
MTNVDALLPDGHPARATQALRPSPIEALCAAAMERLKQRLPGRVVVELFPDKPGEFDFEGYEAAALVLYDGSRFDVGGPLGEQGLREETRLVVSLLVRSLRGEGGAYALLADIRAALHGASLAGSTALRPVEIALEREAEGVWQYRLAFAATLIAVPVKSAPGVALPRGFYPSNP